MCPACKYDVQIDVSARRRVFVALAAVHGGVRSVKPPCAAVIVAISSFRNENRRTEPSESQSDREESMTTAPDDTSVSPSTQPPATATPKGLKNGSLGLVSSVAIGLASTAPAYSLAATLGFIVVGVGLQSPIVMMLAFIPMLFIAMAYKELNTVDPDCGTTFSGGVRASARAPDGWAAGASSSPTSSSWPTSHR
jgi:hypothetical protein